MNGGFAFDSPEGRLLRLGARPVLSGDETARLCELAAAIADWTALVRQAERHGVGPLLSRHAELFAPAAAVADLQAARRKAVVGSLLVERELESIRELFAADGIAWLVVKGVPLSVDAYGEVGLRLAGDVDLLVRQRDARKALSILRAAGYASLLPLREEDWDDVPRVVSEWALSRGMMTIDLHWALAGWAESFPLTTEMAMAGTREVQCGNLGVPTLGLTDLVVYLAFHGSKHFWERLEWIASFRAVSTSAGVSWTEVEARARELGAGRRLAFARAVAEKVLGPEPGSAPPGRGAPSAHDALVSTIASRLFEAGHAEPAPWSAMWSLMSLKDGVLDALRDPLAAFFSPRVTDWSAFSLPRRLRFLYPVLRPFRLLLKHARGLE